jgi:hypothetical protein
VAPLNGGLRNLKLKQMLGDISTRNLIVNPLILIVNKIVKKAPLSDFSMSESGSKLRDYPMGFSAA